MLKTSFLNVRLFLEGQEIPCVSADVQGAPNATAMAAIQVVPTPLAHRIPARTVVHLFFHDLYASAENEGRVYAASSGSQNVAERLQNQPIAPEGADEAAARAAGAGGENLATLDIPEELLRYRLMFTGEVLGLNYAKGSTQRVIVLQCAGHSNYWDMVAADKRGGMLFQGSRQASFGGMNRAPFWDLFLGDTGAVYERLTEPPEMFPNITGFSAGMLHLFEELVGVHYKRTRAGGKIYGMNQFMAMADLRLRLLQQIGVTDGDDSPMRLLRRQGFGGVWQRSLRGIPRYFTYRQLIKALSQYTFYETTPVLCPHYTPPTGEYANYSGWSGFSTGFLRNSTEWAWIPELADSIASLLSGLLSGDLADISSSMEEEGEVNAGLYTGLVADLNACVERAKRLAGQIYEGTTENRSQVYAYRYTGATPYNVDGELSGPQNATNDPGQIYNAAAYDMGQLDTAFWRERGFEPVTRLAPDAIRRLEPVATKAQSIQRLCDTFPRSTLLPYHPDTTVNAKLEEIIALARDIADYVMPPPSRSDDDSNSEPARLYCDIFRPDVWFVPPPRSNVIFPDHVVSMEFSRNFVQEPTRLMIKMYDKLFGSDILFDQWWIAPTSPGLFRGRPVAHSGAAMGRIHRDILEHELMGGIVPVFHTMSDREMFLGGRVAGYAGRNSTAADAEHTSYFQQVTNFFLFKTRFGARSLSLTCRFNPYLICGFPAVVLDGPTNVGDTENNLLLLNSAEEALTQANVSEDAGAVILEMIKGRTGVHYLGNIQQLGHSLSASGEGGGTRVLLGQAREHNEKVEFMGQDIIRMDEDNQRGRTARRLRRRNAEIRRLIQEARLRHVVVAGEADAGLSGVNYDPDFIPAGLRDFVSVPTDANQADYQGMSSTYGFAATEMSSTQRSDDEVVVVQPGRYETTFVFALENPIVRIGTPSENGQPETDDYVPGQWGPKGGEIVSATDVTDQYMGAQRSRNDSGLSADEIALQREAIAEWTEKRNRVQELIGSGGSTPEGTSPQDEGVVADSALIEGYNEQIRLAQGEIDTYRRGWRQEPLTLPFLGTAQDNRGRPLTVITCDRVGVPTSVREFPELISLIGSDDPNMVAEVTLRVFRLTEDMGTDVASVYDFGCEDILRPPWYSDAWLNGSVGGAVYMPLFGTGSIVDPVTVLRPEGMDLFGPEASGTSVAGLTRQWLQYRESREDPNNVIQSSILEGASIEAAVDYLVHMYSITRIAGYDVDSFIRNYTWRPIATMFDVFGSGDLVLDAEGKQIVSGVEGFHSRAFGPYSNLYGLVPQTELQSLLGVSPDDAAATQRLDVRGRRWAIISAYRAELLNLRGASFG